MKPDDNKYISESMDLIAVWNILKSGGRIIAGFCIVAVIFSALYVYLSPSIYQARVVVLAPDDSGVAAFSTIYSKLKSTADSVKEFDSRYVYQIFLRNLNSQAVKRSFFDQIYFPYIKNYKNDITREEALNYLSGALDIRSPKDAALGVTTISFKGFDPQTVAEFSNIFVDYAIEATKDELLNNIKESANNRLLSIDREINLLRESAFFQRKHRIARLEEALRIAENAGLVDATAGGREVFVFSESDKGPNRSLRDDHLAYTRGSAALASELKELKERTIDDPFIAGLSDLNQEKIFLSRYDWMSVPLSPVRIDEPAVVPERAIEPKALIILIAGFLAGLTFGVFFVLLKNAFGREH